MITDNKKYHCLAVKCLSALIKRITSNYVEDFYCLNIHLELKKSLSIIKTYIKIMIIAA